ncbi:uncharacterized protein A4U43_C09F3330 [Asparagus officinalis]|uniref:Uncharacterized protein n=1 Tax=Asparagus officinalis TaxID=4686 RepID=A0A5P1E4Y8_ASPOF|nr:uncharacterized protein A4U43_C09F3330 [Asparagus officinalis]
MANISLSFRSRRAVPTVQSSKNQSDWGDSVFEMQKEAKEEFEKRRKDGVVMEELRDVVLMTQRLRRLLGEGEGREEARSLARELKKSCEGLEGAIQSLEEGVDGLYRGLVDVRICMLRVISDV